MGQRIIITLTIFLFASTLFCRCVEANPHDGTVSAGAASIHSAGSKLDIIQTTDRAVIDWRSFDIDAGEHTEFHQPTNASATLNRINDTKASIINGQLTANGHLFLINQNGVLFGQASRVDINSLVVSTANISNDDFMSGYLNFNQPGQSNALIKNEGIITAEDSGLAGFIAPQIENTGIITARLGRVHLASGDKAVLDLSGDGLIQIAVSDGFAGRLLIDNSGTIESGNILLTSAEARSAVDGLIINTGNLYAGNIGVDAGVFSNTGELNASGDHGGNIGINAYNISQQGAINADGISGDGGEIDIQYGNVYIDNESSRTSADAFNGHGGEINLAGASDSRIFISGEYSAISDQTGGSIDIFASDIGLYGARLNVSGDSGGGEMQVGGGFQGSGDMLKADVTKVNYSSSLKADANISGDGGNVIIWSEQETLFAGSVSAAGGRDGGDGGLIEISSKDSAFFKGRADASSAHGQSGTLLFDPQNIIVSTSGTTLEYFQLVDPNAASGNDFGFEIFVLDTGNVLVTSPGDDFAATSAGAVYLFNGTTGALISALRGSTADDFIGADGSIEVLSNGNYVAENSNWDNGSVVDAGAATWGSGTTGVSGFVSTTNSLVGTTESDFVSSNGVTAFTNGNYVVASNGWNNGIVGDVGAATWGDGTTGITGAVSVANSLVGSAASDFVGTAVTALTNGNYVVTSTTWDNGIVNSAGAATWGDGTTGITGAVSVANSLVGSAASDFVGTGVTALTNGNYVVRSTTWDNGIVNSAGAATWGNGTTGISGVISSANSLVGSASSDRVGNSGVTALANGNYLVVSTTWDNGIVNSAGAVTWGNGTTGISGVISSANSLVGSSTSDSIGTGITELTNGNYVVRSILWDNGIATNAGAATWGSGTTGVSGAISSSNSLIGTASTDAVGTSVVALTNGNYVVTSTSWDNGIATNAGAVTWGNGTTGVTGAVSSSNSLVGSTTSDNVGATVVALTNGNYVVRSPSWDNGIATNVGAATWGNGTTGITGAVSSSNSLVGSTSNDSVGASVIALTNGNYVVRSNSWDNGIIDGAGAATWGNGTTGITGVVSSSNSLVGSFTNDGISSGGITALTNGNYVVRSQSWDNGLVSDVGAVTWGDGTTGITGVVSSSNSLIGSTDDLVGGGGVVSLSNGNYLVISPDWDNGLVTDAGAASLCNGAEGCTGAVGVSNSLIGSIASANLVSSVTDSVNDRAIILFDDAEEIFSLNIEFLDANDLTYSLDSDTDYTIHPLVLTNVLDTGTAVVLQANNDITLSDNITVSNSGSGGDLTFQAGRSILINADITTDNGDLNIYANEDLSTGVVDAQRDSGDAVITMASGTNIDAGTGSVSIRLDDGTGKTNLSAGDITLRDIIAAYMIIQNKNSGVDVVLNGTLTASTSGTAIIISSLRNLVNNAGASALSASSGRWLTYSTKPTQDTAGGLVNQFVRFNCLYDGSCFGVPISGNGFLYSYNLTLSTSNTAVAANTDERYISENLLTAGYLFNPMIADYSEARVYLSNSLFRDMQQLYR